jgi:hypothetical protein
MARLYRLADLVLVTVALAVGARGDEALAPGEWIKVDEGKTGERSASALVYAPDSRQMILVGPAKGAPFVQAFDPAARTWTDVSSGGPSKDSISPYYQAAYDPGSRTLYCLSGGAVMYSFSTADKTWKTHPPAPELDGLSWHAMACDPAGRRLVVVGADKKVDNLGWMRTVVYDIPAGRWTCLDVAGEKTAAERRELVAAKEAAIDLAGRIRLAWYRDPAGAATDAERKALGRRCDALKGLPQMARWTADVDAAAGLIAQSKMLDALKSVRAVQRKIEEFAEARYPAPASRRNSPLVFEPKSDVFVLFGGDHEDYLMNDTWVLDLVNKASPWRRARPAVAPSPRAGHALCALPKSGRVALYEGYVRTSSDDYGAVPYAPVDPLQLWLYDPKADRWDLAASWPLPGKTASATPAPLGMFCGYSAERFSPPALAATEDDLLVLAGHVCNLWSWRWKRPCETWLLRADPARTDAAGRERLGAAADSRLYRTGPFTASFCEVPDEPKDMGLDRLPDNRWVRLPDPPRNPCRGCRQRDWGTSVWDPDRDQVLLWGGGHCVRSASTVAHWSPASGRIVEGYDADEPYGGNGSGGYDSSILDRPWVSVHNYNHYAYDPKCQMLVAGRGYLYDPDRMDWVRMERMDLPYKFAWGSTVVEASAHGAVAWAQKKNSEDFGLWLFDSGKGWADLEPRGKVFAPYCDANGMVYDSKRDRMVLSGPGGGYEKVSSGSFVTFDFKTRSVDTVTPANPELARTRNARELAYVEHADWILIGETYPRGDSKAGKRYTRVYDCGANRMFLLDAGPVPDGHSTGWVYDAKRKLAYVFTFRGEAWAIRPEPRTAKPLDSAQE